MKQTLVTIDLSPLFRKFIPSPFCIMGSAYQRCPVLLSLVVDIGMMTFFKLSYMLPADEPGSDALIWQYFEYTDSPWLEIIPGDQALLTEFDDFLRIFMLEADLFLEQTLSHAGLSLPCEELLFEHASTSDSVLMMYEN